KEIIEQLAAQVSSELKMTLLSERLSKSEEFLNSILNSLPGGIIILDKKGIIRKSNPTAEEMFHIKDVEGKNLKEVLSDPRILDNIKSIKNRGSFEAIIRKNGKENHLNFELSKAKEISSSGIEEEYSIIQINDITERVELNRLKYLQEINANFTLGLSHRLRTPLTPILGLSSILKNQKDLQENYKEMAKTIYDSSLEMKDMVEKLLDIAEIGSDKAIQTDEKINLNLTLNEIIKDFNDITIRSNVKNNDLHIYGNRSWLIKSLRQLFAICLKNHNKDLQFEVEETKEYLYLNFRNSKSLIDDFSALENSPILSFDNPLTGDSDIKYLDIPLIRLILNKHNVRIIVKEDELLLSLRFKKAES
ncbi:MAG: histidine kinase dimerization/phospho-acceptor domain-containing protein, partial [candidate division WOR-3 bacterium]